jgi:ABC-type transporter Mla maintaining outer membrane lipid asymmetry permease subunit MlaE
MTPDIRHLTPLMAALVIGGAVGAAPATAPGGDELPG